VTLALYVAVVLQTVLAPSMQILGIRPDFPFLIVLLVAFHEGAAGGALAGFVCGLFVDLSSTSVLGVSSLASSLIAFGVGTIAHRLVRGSLLARAVVAFAATTLLDQVLFTFGPSAGSGSAIRYFFLGAIPGGLYTAALAVPVMAAAERLVGWGRETVRGYR
jgi:rod shape-determining protein MreD